MRCAFARNAVAAALAALVLCLAAGADAPPASPPTRPAPGSPANTAVVGTAAAGTAAAGTVAGGTAAADAPLAQDPRLQTGELANGLKWIFRAHDNPPGKLALMLHVKTGSLNETEEQRGLAHFIEHMCFNGTENYAPGKLVPYFESIGMEFGADLNASTGFDATRYTLFLPDTQAGGIDKALQVLSDYAFRALMLDEEIDKERGVILSEKRARDNVAARVQEAEWKQLYSDALFSHRIPIGAEDVLNHAKRDRFVDYYRKWYRPDHMTLVVVGDTTLPQVGPLIEKNFGAQATVTDAKPPQAEAGMKPHDGQRALVLSDRDYHYCNLEISNILAPRPPVATRQAFRQDLVDTVLRQIINRRYAERQRTGQATYQNAAAGVSRFMTNPIIASATFASKPADWEKSLDELVEEITRVREHGFMQRELDLIKRQMLAEAERAVRTAPTANANGLMFRISGAIDDGEVYQSAEQRLELVKQLFTEITVEEVTGAFQASFRPENWTAVLKIDPAAGQTPTDEALLAAMRAALARPTSRPPETLEEHPLVASALKPAEVLEPTSNEKLGISSAWLSNGVRVHHRFMDYKKDQVLVSINLAGGHLEETAENYGVSQLAELVFSQPATRRLSSTEIQDLLTGKNIRVTGAASSDRIGVRLLGSPRDLEMGLQVAYALLTEGKLEEPAFETWKAQRLQQAQFLKAFIQFQAAKAFNKLLTNNDPRFRLMDVEQVEAQTLAVAQAWLDRMTASAPIEVAVVGEISREQAFSLVAQYIGSLPARPRVAAHLGSLRKLDRPDGPLRETVTVETGSKQAEVRYGFLTAAAEADPDHLALQLAEKVLTTRLIKNLREEKAWVYSIQGSSGRRRDLEDMCTFSAGSTCAPENTEKVVSEIQGLFAAFAESGPTEEELANGKKQIINNRDTRMKEPQFWWTILEVLDLHRINLAPFEEPAAEVEALSAGQVRDTFAKYYRPERTFTVIASVPVESGEQTEPAMGGGSEAGLPLP